MFLGDLVGTCYQQRGGFEEDRARLFTDVCSRRMRHSSHKPKQGSLQRDIRNIFLQSDSQPLKQGFREAVGPPALKVIKMSLSPDLRADPASSWRLD